MTPRQKRIARKHTPKTGAVVYLRVSTTRQASSGLGLEAQRAKCLEHAARLGLPVLSEHEDPALSGRSAVKDRPGLQAAIAAVKAAPDAVLIVYSLSRLGRSQRLIWELLDDRGPYALPISSATEAFDTSTPMGRAMLGMLGVWAQLEADLCSERTIDALQAAIERGTRLGAPGMVESTDADGKRYVDPAKVAIVRIVQKLHADTGQSLRALAATLNDRGIASVKGGKWHPRTVAIALRTAVAS